jgi:hypothetical protein
VIFGRLDWACIVLQSSQVEKVEGTRLTYNGCERPREVAAVTPRLKTRFCAKQILGRTNVEAKIVKSTREDVIRRID